MIPIYLKMEGFLTFKNPTELRFDEFAEDGLFLVSGPTGSGKTSIFDAINYALYGVATSAQRSPAELRSHLIGPDDDFSVEFKFRAGSSEYLISRWQKGQRPSKVRLIIDGNEGEGLIKVREINDKIFEILGLTADQFGKIVMLPQGEFRNFLAASSKEKSDILRKLFATEHYAQIRDMIRTRLGRIKNQVDGAMILIDSEKKVSAQANSAADPQEIEAIITKEWQEAKTEADTYRDNLKLLRSQLDHLGGVLTESTRLNEELAKLEELEMAVAKAALLEPRFQADLELAGRLNRVRPIKVLKDNLRRDEASLALILKTQADRRLDLAKAQASLAGAIEQADGNPQRQERLTAIARELDSLAKSLEALAELHQTQTKHARADQHLQGLASRQAQSQQWQKTRDTLSQAMETAGAAEREAARAVASRREEWQELRPCLKAAEAWQHLREKLSALEKDILTSRSSQTSLEEAILTRRGELAQIKAELELQGLGKYAHSLKPGEACPLCGSPDHPAPFAGNPLINQRTLDEAEANLRQTEKDLAEETSRVRYLELDQREKKNQKESLEADYPPEVLSQDLAELGQALADLAQSGKELSQLHKQSEEQLNSLTNQRREAIAQIEAIGDVTKEFDLARDELTALNVRLADLSARTKDLDEASLTASQKGLAKEEADTALLIKEAAQALRQSQERVTALKATLESLAEQVTKLTEVIAAEKSEFETAIAQMDLSLEEYLALESRLEQEKGLRQAAEEFFRQLTGDRTRCQMLQDQLSGKVKADLAAQKSEIARIKEQEERLNDTCDQCLRKESRLEGARKKISEARVQYDRASLEYEVAKRLDQTTGKGTTFENYVLGYYLDGVLANANARLKNMTSGRFRLLRQNQDSGDKNKIEGLDLLVFDAYSNSQRDVRTLSGGEGFKAALALALGLSDFIQEKNAGIRLDTIFIDEGFGTLDQESLDSAMETILELQGMGRLVGIISHVEELKERIPTQIVVENHREEGSVLKVIKH